MWREENQHDRETVGRSGFSVRAERLLVRVLLALRGEARRTRDPVAEQLRAEQLADVILADFPRRILPLGIAALIAIVLLCSMPLLRDALAAQGVRGSSAAPAALAVERGIRAQGAAVGEGLDAIRSVVAPFASDSAPSEAASESDRCPQPSCDAAAPYKKS